VANGSPGVFFLPSPSCRQWLENRRFHVRREFKNTIVMPSNLGVLGVLEICATGNCRPVSVFRQSTLVEAR
jgi:hypothetical protein